MNYLHHYRCIRKELFLISNTPQKMFIKCIYPWYNCVKYSISISDSDVYSKCCLLQEVQRFYSHFKAVNEWSGCTTLALWCWISYTSWWVEFQMVYQLYCNFGRKFVFGFLCLSSKTGFLTELPTPTLPRVMRITKCLSKKAVKFSNQGLYHGCRNIWWKQSKADLPEVGISRK